MTPKVFIKTQKGWQKLPELLQPEALKWAMTHETIRVYVEQGIPGYSGASAFDDEGNQWLVSGCGMKFITFAESVQHNFEGPSPIRK